MTISIIAIVLCSGMTALDAWLTRRWKRLRDEAQAATARYETAVAESKALNERYEVIAAANERHAANAAVILDRVRDSSAAVKMSIGICYGIAYAVRHELGDSRDEVNRLLSVVNALPDVRTDWDDELRKIAGTE